MTACESVSAEPKRHCRVGHGVQAVLFDVGGVLLSLGEAEYRRHVLQGLGLRSMPEDYEEVMARLQRGELREGDLWTRWAGRPVAADAFDAAWLENVPPIPAMLDLARELRALGVRTAILSNTQPSHVRMMRGMGFLEGFDPILFSCEVGCRKPELEIYRLALERLGLPPEQVAYVEDVPDYVEAAAKLGLRAILHQGDVGATRRALEAAL